MLTQEELLTEQKAAVEMNKLYQPLLIIIITLIILLFISFIPADTTLAGLQIKSIDMISDIKPD